MSDLLSQLPAALVQFLHANGGRTIRFDPSVMPRMQMDAAEFRTPDELKLSSFEVNTGEYYENYGETGDDPDLQYVIEGIDLLRGCGCEGLLAWFPGFGEFGAWDCDHLILTMFPNTGWERIMERLPQYINAQWYPGTVEEYLLRPWSDERCRDIPSIQRGFM